MVIKKQEINILKGSLIKNILFFTLPIALSSMLQQLFNAVDTSVVGYFINSNALAAVGTNGEIIALILTVSSGVAVGINVVIAKRIGQQNHSSIENIIHTALILAAVIGIIGMITGQCLSFSLLSMIKVPSAVLSEAILYLRVYLIGYPFLLLFDFGSAILRAYGNSKYPFIALMVTGVVNVLLNLCFVLFFNMGVLGVAIATDIATALSAAMVIIKLITACNDFKLFSEEIKISFDEVCEILKIGVPSAVQGAVFCLANIFVQASVNSFGAASAAGSTISVNYEYLVYYIITSFGQTATTFIGQNYAAGQIGRCRNILKICTAYSFIISAFFVVVLVLFRTEASEIFATNANVIEISSLRILCILSAEPICSFYEIPAGVLRGCGHSAEPAAITLVGICAFRITWICTVFLRIHTLETLFIAFPISWLITIVIIWIGFAFIKPFKRDKRLLC